LGQQANLRLVSVRVGSETAFKELDDRAVHGDDVCMAKLGPRVAAISASGKE
jgi:hypothetical protein